MTILYPPVSDIVVSFFLPAIYLGIIVAFIGLIGIAFEKKDIHILILSDIVGLAMLIIVAAVGTDLAEALLLPGLVVELAEIMAISEILIAREMRKIETAPTRDRGVIKRPSVLPVPLNLDMEILHTAPNFIALLMVVYGVFLTGFTGGAIAGGGILFYVLSKKTRGLDVLVIEGIKGVSGMAWCFWIIGFVIFFVTPQYWLLGLFMAACGLVLKVATKLGLIGSLMREEYNRE